LNYKRLVYNGQPHFSKGECCVDSGSFEEMETKKEILIDRGLSATIE
jgi:hypothetical protein